MTKNDSYMKTSGFTFTKILKWIFFFPLMIVLGAQDQILRM